MTPRYSFADIQAAFPPIHSAPPSPSGSVQSSMIALPGKRPEVFAAYEGALPDLNAAAQAGMPERNWFDRLARDQQSRLIQQIAEHPGVVALADQPRPEWMPLMFAFADAGHRGVAEARDIALNWSKTSPRFSMAGFDSIWNSFNPGRLGGVTVATLLNAAENAGFNLEPWRATGRGPISIASPTTAGPGKTHAPIATVGRRFAISGLPKFMAPDQALQLVNEIFFVAHDWGGEPLVGHVRADGVRAVNERQLRMMLNNRYVREPEEGRRIAGHLLVGTPPKA